MFPGCFALIMSPSLITARKSASHDLLKTPGNGGDLTLLLSYVLTVNIREKPSLAFAKGKRKGTILKCTRAFYS